jgi:hypothetical protein
MRVYKPKKLEDGSYAWQEAFVDVIAHSYVLPSFVWQTLPGMGDGRTLLKKYRTYKEAINALKSSISLINNFITNCCVPIIEEENE